MIATGKLLKNTKNSGTKQQVVPVWWYAADDLLFEAVTSLGASE